MASLVTADGNSFELAEAETLIGRGGREFNDPPKVDVGPLTGGPTVSRHHGRVFLRAGRWYLRVEPAARNPTLVAGKTIPGGEEVPLANNVEIQMGDVVMTFKGPSERPVSAPDATMTGLEENSSSIAPPSAPTPIAAAVAEIAPGRPADGASPASQPTSKPTAEWAARLPERPATIGAIGVTEFRRVNPFRGLMIDDQTWADAHDYHRAQTRLHHLSAHGWGIVEGLEVVADAQVPNTLVIRPGVAVDAQGHMLLLSQERRLTVQASAGSTLYVTLRLSEELASPQRFWSDVDEYTRVVERSQASLQSAVPAPPSLELARLIVDGPTRNAPEPLSPGRGEIDLRFRERLPFRPRPDLAVAQLVTGGDSDATSSSLHQVGLRYLLREIGGTTGYRPRWAGSVRLGDPLPPVSMLYFPGDGAFKVEGDAVRIVGDFLRSGGVMMADGCRQGQWSDFARSVETLASALECNLQPVERWHPLLSSRHIFSELPVVSEEGTSVAEGGGLILSNADYGCAWQGGPDDRTLSRDIIRASLEFGVNVAVYARHRQRPLEVIELES
ncbi:MAG TPA: DUF4159 domain-containing protein [Chloroflexota bacterium]|nr:DUF4159 domain-containing protein [Chloroflexota bacterium]